MKEIQLGTRGKVALIDDADFDLISRYTWHGSLLSGRWYAVHTTSRTLGPQRSLFMHRLIMGVTGNQVDHKDGNGLNNCRDNLRLSTQQQNLYNRRLKNELGFIGVCRSAGKFAYHIRIPDGRRLHVCGFDTPEAAARARDKVAVEHHGEFAVLNFGSNLADTQVWIPKAALAAVEKEG